MDVERLRTAYEELARKTVEDRLAFADRVQEVLDHAQRLQAELDDRTEQVRGLRADVEALRVRVDELHRELVEAHESQDALLNSRSFRYTRPLRKLGRVLPRR